ncbi:PorP/SprF family type IX secretion system membrane protein [Autumnicola musiva]|uniref:PorP/SprF family type IX secretion system membrane protein n=1 Tax=Autumnicola musiva TaxID=3075589 RepID=A0ABU3DCG6_9FLAO|nr:PorP/SprF family type IX secretion system membrane protein [Zunongwangia sp. F117]MDT0678663.1 PorP/SprF family type IX secretion system membrane protein [Zunongwangia sp. F117]
MIRKQWLSFSSPLNGNKMGIGLNLFHDKIGPSSYKSFAAVYAYNIKVNRNIILALGVNAGGSLLDIDLTQGSFENPSDNANITLDNKFYARVGAGALLSSDSWFLVLSVPNFFKEDFYDDKIMNVVADKLQFNVLAGYMFPLNRNRDLIFRPSVLAHIVEGNHITLNTNANFFAL